MPRQLSKQRRSFRSDPSVKRGVLRSLRTICASLRQLQHDPAAVRAYREVEALLAVEEKRVSKH